MNIFNIYKIRICLIATIVLIVTIREAKGVNNVPAKTKGESGIDADSVISQLGKLEFRILSQGCRKR
jgi:hypothetical protein